MCVQRKLTTGTLRVCILNAGGEALAGGGGASDFHISSATLKRGAWQGQKYRKGGSF